MSVRILVGDALAMCAGLPERSHRCCVTSPPYFGLRDYGVDGQIGREASAEAYVARLVAVFREVRRVLCDDGTLWLNIGDSYAAKPPGCGGASKSSGLHGARVSSKYRDTLDRAQGTKMDTVRGQGVKPKDLLGIPWMLAFALCADGWFLRAENIWNKPNPMPESVLDRPTRAHEQVFLLSKSARYFYDSEGISEEAVGTNLHDLTGGRYAPPGQTPHRGGRRARTATSSVPCGKRNARSVWTIATQPFVGAHFAVMPPRLAERCIRAGTAPGDLVLDPFGGAGTTGLVATSIGRGATLVELNPEYADIARRRIGLFAEVA